MNFEILVTENFEKRLKKLLKKYESLPQDLSQMIEELSVKPLTGTPIGKNCYKIRVAISSKGKG
ncbi:MAG: hypothetical protein WAT79_04445 [Saprospiraceae bacterium]